MKLYDAVKLLTVPGIGMHRARLLLAKFDTVENIFKANYQALCRVESIDRKLANAIMKHDMRLADKQLNAIQKDGAGALTYWDAD